MDPLARDVLTFWFGTADLAGKIDRRAVWFRATPEFDAALVERYRDALARAAAGEIDQLQDGREDCVSLILMLDQFPRNIFRGTARAFASDAKARRVARHAIARGFDRGLHLWPRTFIYLPFEHSEDLADQERGVALFRSLGDPRTLDSALAHRDTIRRFGRFPHRNAALGRANTPEEEDYLRNPPLWGKTAAEAADLERSKAARAGPTA